MALIASVAVVVTWQAVGSRVLSWAAASVTHGATSSRAQTSTHSGAAALVIDRYAVDERPVSAAPTPTPVQVGTEDGSGGSCDFNCRLARLLAGAPPAPYLPPPPGTRGILKYPTPSPGAITLPPVPTPSPK